MSIAIHRLRLSENRHRQLFPAGRIHVVLATFLSLLCAYSLFGQAPSEPRVKLKPKFTIARDTTVVDGPLDSDGFIDYAKALNERFRKGVTPANNANILIWQAIGPRPGGMKPLPKSYFEWMGIEEPADQGDYFVDLLAFLKIDRKVDRNKKADEMEAELSRCTAYPWKTADHMRIADWLEANEKTLSLVIRASQLPKYFAPQEAGLGSVYQGLLAARVPDVHTCRAIANALAAQAMNDVAEGRSNSAWQRIVACHRLGRLLTHGGTSIQFLAGISVDMIAGKAALGFLESPATSEAQFRNYIGELERLPAMFPAVDIINAAERFMYLDTVLMINRWGLQYLEELHPIFGRAEKPHPLLKPLSEAIDWDPALSLGNQWFDRSVTAMRQQNRIARTKALNQIDQEFKTFKKDVFDGRNIDETKKSRMPIKLLSKQYGDIVFGALWLPTRSIQLSADHSEQTSINLRAALALAAYKKEHSRYPETLNALAPKYLAEIPMDLFTGKALRYQASANGYLLYSVGPNGLDEQGRGMDDSPKGDDLSVRMPLPVK